jgi:hypothetical protein
MVLMPITSSHLRAAGYDPGSRTLWVQFERGEIYQYDDVPPDLYQLMIESQPHPWSAVNRVLRADHAYRRLSR